MPSFAWVPFWKSLLLAATVVGVAPGGWAQGVDATLFRRYRALDGNLERASRAVGTGRFAEAQALLEPCLHAIPDHFEAHFLLARMAYEARDFTGVLAHLAISEQSLAALDRLFREQVAQMRAQAEAEEQLAQSNLDAVTSRVADPTGCAAPLIASLQHEVSALQSRKGPLHSRENPYSVPADYRFLQGNAHLRLGHRNEALGRFRLAVEIDPSHANAWNNLLAMHLDAREDAQARAGLAQAEAAKIVIRPDLKKAILEAQPARP